MPSRPLFAALLLLGALHGAPARAGDAEEDGKSRFRHPSAGVAADVPPGWRVAADRGGPAAWKRLATFWDPKTDSDAVLSARARNASNLEDLEASVRAEWAATPELLITASRRLPAAPPARPVPMLVLDATYTKKAEPNKGEAPPAVPPPPVTWRINATYCLAGGFEYLLYAQAQATHWSRVEPALSTLRLSLSFPLGASADGPVGEGAYRNEEHAFSCRHPKDYSVVVPQRSAHVVRFEGPSADDCELGVYHIAFDGSDEEDATRLVEHYVSSGGQARQRTLEVFGKPARLVEAQASVGGKDVTILVAVVKRGGSEVFRLRAQMPRGSEAKGRRVFDAFVASFQMGAAAK